MIALAWQLGPRVDEIAGLTMKDITLAEGTAPGSSSALSGKATSSARSRPGWWAMLPAI